MWKHIIKKRLTSFWFETTPRISFIWKIAPALYKEYENGMLRRTALSLQALTTEISERKTVISMHEYWRRARLPVWKNGRNFVDRVNKKATNFTCFPNFPGTQQHFNVSKEKLLFYCLLNSKLPKKIYGCPSINKSTEEILMYIRIICSPLSFHHCSLHYYLSPQAALRMQRKLRSTSKSAVRFSALNPELSLDVSKTGDENGL